MNKTIPFVLAMILILTLVACEASKSLLNSGQAPESVTVENISSPESRDSSENANDVGSVGDISSESEEEDAMETMPNMVNKECKLTVGETEITAELDDSEIARQFIALLPQTITMSRGRDREYYGRIDGTLQYDEGDIQTFAEDGDLAYWFSGNSLAFFFNTENDSAVNSGIVVFGKLTSDLSVLDDMGGSETMTVTLAE